MIQGGATILSVLTGFAGGVAGALVVRGVDKVSAPGAPALPAKVSGADDLGGLVVREIVRQTNNLGAAGAVPLDGQVLVSKMSKAQKDAALRAARAGAPPAAVFQAAGITVRQLEDSRLPAAPVAAGVALLPPSSAPSSAPLLKKDCGCSACKHGTEHGHGAEPCAGCAAAAAAPASAPPKFYVSKAPAAAPAAPVASADEDAEPVEDLDTVSGDELGGDELGAAAIVEIKPAIADMLFRTGKTTTLNGDEEEADELGGFAIPIRIVAGALPAGVSGDHVDDLGWATWTTSTRPRSPGEGETGYNADTARLETWSGGRWTLTDGELGGWSIPVKVAKYGIPVRTKDTPGGFAIPVSVGERGIPIRLVDGGGAKVSGDVGGFITNLQDKAVRMGILSFCRGALKDAEAADRAPAAPDNTAGVGDDVFRALTAGGGAVTDVFVPGAGTALRSAATKIKRKVDKKTGHVDRHDRPDDDDEAITLNGGEASMMEPEQLDGDDLGDGADDLGLVYKGVAVTTPKHKIMKAGKSYKVNSPMMAIDKGTFKDWKTRFSIHPIQELARAKKRIKKISLLFKKNTARMKRSIAKNLPYMTENAALKQQIAILQAQIGAGGGMGVPGMLEAGGGFEGGFDGGDAAYFAPDMVAPGPVFGEGMDALDMEAGLDMGDGLDMSMSDELGDDGDELGDDELGDDELGDDELGDDELGDDELGDDDLGDGDLGEEDGDLGAMDASGRRLLNRTRQALTVQKTQKTVVRAQRNRTRNELRYARQRLAKCKRVIAQLRAKNRNPSALIIQQQGKYEAIVGALTNALRQGIAVLRQENRRIRMNGRGQSADGLSGQEGDIAGANLGAYPLNSGSKGKNPGGGAPRAKGRPNYPRAHQPTRFFRQQVPAYTSPDDGTLDEGPLDEGMLDEGPLESTTDETMLEGLDNIGCAPCQNIHARGSFVADIVPDYSRANDGT